MVHYYTIYNYLYSIIEATIELKNYNNLPKGLDKYAIENGLLTNGVIGIVKLGDEYFVVNVLLDYGTNFYDGKNYSNIVNIAILPRYAKITLSQGDIFKSIYNKPLKVGSQIFIIRNNLNQNSLFVKIFRYLKLYEEIIFQIEKNNKVASAKVFPLLEETTPTDDNNQESKVWNNLLVSDNTAHPISVRDDLLKVLKDSNIKEPFLSLELQDRINELQQALQLVKNEIKEKCGFDVMDLGGKKERAISGEINVSSSLSKYMIEHSINIRKNDFDILNKYYNLNITIEKNDLADGMTLKGADDNAKV